MKTLVVDWINVVIGGMRSEFCSDLTSSLSDWGWLTVVDIGLGRTSVLCRSKERRTTTTFSMEVFDNELVPSSVPQIAPIIRVANEFQSRRPRVAFLSKGDVDQAFSAFKIVLDGDRDNIPALLGQVRVSDSTLHEPLPDIRSRLGGKWQLFQSLPLMNTMLVMLLKDYLGNHGSNLTEEELETHTISAWKEAKLYLLKQSTEHGKIFSKRLVQAGPDENLKDITLKILQNRVATLPITHSTSDDGSYP
ncbi:hypothetical protein Tco_1288749, partial [Tanacetum coccineum]